VTAIRAAAAGPRAAVAVLVALALAGVVVIVAVGVQVVGREPVRLEQQVREFTDRLTPRGPYRPPTSEERNAVVGAVASLVASGSDAAGPARHTLEEAGFTVGVSSTDAGQEYLVARSDPAAERSWGVIALPLGTTPRLLVEVPHAGADYETEEVGLAVLAEVPDAVYLQAGAHRRAADERADVAHEEDSLFHALAVDLSTRLRLPQLQLHGFGDRDDLDEDIVLGGGPDHPAPQVEALADRIEESGLSVCRAWAGRCSELEGRTNVQGRAAARAGLPFAHVELSASIRARPVEVAPVLAALAG
jgi:hypothetical protein